MFLIEFLQPIHSVSIAETFEEHGEINAGKALLLKLVKKFKWIFEVLMLYDQPNVF